MSGRYRDLPRDRLRHRRRGIIGGGPRLRQPWFRALGSGELLILEANDAVRRHGEHIALCHNNTSYIEVRETMEHLPSTFMREDVSPHFLSSAVFSLL